MVYSFAKIGAAVAMKADDYFRYRKLPVAPLHEKCSRICGLILSMQTAFSALNAILLGCRIRLEEHALGDCYQRAFARRSRFIPGIFGQTLGGKAR